MWGLLLSHACKAAIYKVCPEGIQPCNMKNRDIYWRRHKIQETLYVGQWHLSPLQSSRFGTSHSSPNCHQLLHLISLNLIDGLKSLPPQRWFAFSEKPEVAGHQILGCSGAESPGWFDVSPKNSAGDMVHEQVRRYDEAANHQLPIAVAFWITWIFSMEECWSLMQYLIQIRCSTCSVIFNTIATQYTCSLNSVYHPHWLVQRSCYCSCMHIPVHSPWLPGYTDVVQTVLVILTMAGLFLDRLLYIYIFIVVVSSLGPPRISHQNAIQLARGLLEKISCEWKMGSFGGGWRIQRG